MIWFEICELAPNGDYLPVSVDDIHDQPGIGRFMLKQGLQRRISITIVHESDIPDLRFKDVKELVVGRLRTTPQSESGGGENLENPEPPVLSLSLLPASYTAENTNDERSFFHFQASWDSSLHNSALLNRVTPNGKQVGIGYF